MLIGLLLQIVPSRELKLPQSLEILDTSDIETIHKFSDSNTVSEHTDLDHGENIIQESRKDKSTDGIQDDNHADIRYQ